MKKMNSVTRKFIALALALMLAAVSLVGLTSCEKKDNSDLSTIQKNGKLVVGITEFQPMDYRDADGKWIGFDADLANEFAAYIGVKAEFSIIDWNNKVFELNAGTIDCVWNGMTLTDEVKSSMSTSDPYFNNAQVVIVRADKADSVKTVEDCKALKFAVEKGSAGEAAAQANGFTTTPVTDQATALMEVKSGTSEAAIIDILMAVTTVGEGTDYADLAVTSVSLSSEVYGVGFRKESDLTAKLNEFFAAKAADGTLKKIAEKYGIQDYLIKD